MSELREYGRKRHFRRTPEPPPQAQPGKGPLLFVVQQHRARHLHYDLRLELDGVLKSWALPKGPSLDPEVKRLAVMVEDHPLPYANFEGVIPEGEYGAGEVIVWDRGSYSPDKDGRLLFDDRAQAEAVVREGLAQGKLSVFLRGEKLKGSFIMVRMAGHDKDWLFIKHRDDYVKLAAEAPKGESVVSGRTLEEVKTGEPPAATHKATLRPGDVPGAHPTRFPARVAPMLAYLADAPFSHPGWIFEPKLDGYRTLALLHDGEVRLLSRRANDVTDRYAILVPEIARQPAVELILDGEIVAMDEKGHLCFQCLQQYLQSLGHPNSQGETTPLIYYVFDILYLDGYDLRGASLKSRRELLAAILHPTEHVRPMSYFEAEGERVYQAAIANGLEGVVAKDLESIYESGKRSRSWLKVKAMLSDDFVVGGYTVGEGYRTKSFGSLLIGYFDREGKLIYAGHVGSGFDEATLAELLGRLEPLRTDKSPFTTPPPDSGPVIWMRPELVVEVKYSQWTDEGRLRIPVFLRLREDKPAREAHRAEVVSVAASPPQPDDPATGVESILTQLRNPKADFTLEVDEVRIPLSHLDKVLWSASEVHPALTKRDFLSYLARVSSYLLPHLKDRPLSLSRYPNGIHGEHFFQKHWNSPLPDFVARVNIRSEENGQYQEYLMCQNLATLLWLGQVADLEFHTWFSRLDPSPDLAKPKKTGETEALLDYPDFLIFDLDPYIYSGKEPKGAEPELNREGFARASEMALKLKELLDGLSLAAFVKTSGKTGLHIHVPIIRRLDYHAVRAAAQTIGQFLVSKYPNEVTMGWAVEKRTGKVFLDYGQNVRGKTLASAYSPRPVPEATVSTPLAWGEVGKVYPTDFTMLSLPQRLEKRGDLWADILKAKSDLAARLSGKTPG